MKVASRWLGSAVSGAVVLVSACSSQPGPAFTGSSGGAARSVGNTPANSTGAVGLALSIAPGVQFVSLTWTISGGELSMPLSSPVLIADAQSIEFVVGDLPAGGPYTIVLTGADTNGDPCSGSATFSISPGTTSSAVVTMNCIAPADAAVSAAVTTGNAAIDAGVTYVTGAPYHCPGISGFGISPAEIVAPQTASLSVDTTVADGGSPGTPTILWSTTSGTFADTGTTTSTLADPTFSCGSFVGTAVVTVTLGLIGSNNGADAGNVCANALYQTISGNIVCDATCFHNSDCPASSSPCLLPACTAGQCTTTDAPEGTSCGTNEICNQVGACVPFTFDVAQVGTGSATLGITATAVFIDQYNVSNGSLVSKIALPTAVGDGGAASTPFATTGTSVTEGQLSRSVNGRYLSIAGYAAAAGTSGIAASTSLPRVVARIDALGNVDTSTVLSQLFAGDVLFAASNPRSAVSVDGTAFWVGGQGSTVGPTGSTIDTGGIWYVPFGAAAANLTQSVNQIAGGAIRVAGIYGGQLYADGDTAAAPQVFDVGSGLPTSGEQTLTELPGLPAAGTMSAWAFVFFDLIPSVVGVDTLYVANDTLAVNEAGAGYPMGILKFTYNGSTWSMAQAIGAGTGFHGLAAVQTPTSSAPNAVTLIGTTTAAIPNQVQIFTDTGIPVDGGTTTVVVAGTTITGSANTLFRGVALPPHI